MRKYISIIFGALLLSLVACTEEVVDPNAYIGDGNKIILSVKSPSAEVTRSADTDVESALALIDVYIMDENYEMVYKERLDNTASPVYGEGKFTLEKGRDEFEEGKKYFVYIVANSTVEMAEMADDWAELKSLTQTNSNVHLSGMNIQQVASGDMPPKYFLMDGHAYVGNSEPENMTAYVINDKNTEDTILKATLYRAAAKIVVNLIQGESVEFHKLLENATPLYSFYQLPISTLVVNPAISGLRHNSEKQTTLEWGLSTNNFNWTEDENSNPVITYVGYAYANDWSNKNAVNESSLLFSIPMKWDADGNGSKEKNSPVNWYKVPVSKTQKFERNKCYILNVNINAIGAEEKNVPVELDVEYITLDWEEVTVNIGENEARYLTLNTDLVKIYDANFDLDQLTFTSSSPIKSIKLKDVFNHDERREGKSAFSALELLQESDGTTEAEYKGGDEVYAYYIDKFGQKVQLGTDPGFALKDVDHQDWTKSDILNLEAHLLDFKQKADDGTFLLDSEGKPVSMGKSPSEQYIRAVVPAGQERALNGNIHIYSPIIADKTNPDLNWNSHFNTTRYLEFEVMNEQGLTASFRVEQIPYILITHEEGFFSYRSDQKYSDDWEEASHFLNYKGGKSLHLSGLMWNYVYDWTNEPGPENTEYWGTDELHRDYSWVPSHGTGLAHNCEVLHYGNIGVPHTFYDSRGVAVTYTYGGLYRSAVHPTGAFVRERYYLLADAQCNGIYSKGGYRFNSKNYDHPKGDVQGNAVGPVYEENGKKYRKHFTWNVQPIFYNLYVSEVYDADGTNPSGKARTKGQADINQMTHATDVSIDGEGTGWMSWGIMSYTNHRMYNVRTTTPQLGYTIGFPDLNEDGTVVNKPDFAVMISPNLQVASQLGETRYQSVLNEAAKYPTQYKVPEVGKFYKLAEEHCREYVETVYINEEGRVDWWKDGQNTDKNKVIHYDDWRLPTKAEINKMIELQESSRAMDRLLVGQYYFCITGKGDDANINVKENWISEEIPNYDSGKAGYYIRCVRDVNRKK